MDGITAALAAQQAMTQNLIGMEMIKMAAQNQQQMVALLSQVVASNPAHLGQSLDTFA